MYFSFKENGEKIGLKVYFPKGIYCTDNGVMIGTAAYYLEKFGVRGDLFLNAYSSGEIK